MMTVPCKSCKAPIFFAVARMTGRRIPVDSQPSREGNLSLDIQGSVAAADVLAGDSLVAARERGDTLYMSHFATCPDRHRHRKSDRKRAPAER